MGVADVFYIRAASNQREAWLVRRLPTGGNPQQLSIRQQKYSSAETQAGQVSFATCLEPWYKSGGRCIIHMIA